MRGRAPLAMNGAAMSSCRIEGELGVQARDRAASRMRSILFLRALRVVAQRCMWYVVSDQARCRSTPRFRVEVCAPASRIVSRAVAG